MDMALQAHSYLRLQEAIQANHHLLVSVGVVPERVQHFIKQVEEQKGAAKICGAGAVAGDNAGAVLVMMDDKLALHSLCRRFDYQLLSVTCESRGLHAA
jgi:mevalonate kinase